MTDKERKESLRRKNERIVTLQEIVNKQDGLIASLKEALRTRDEIVENYKQQAVSLKKMVANLESEIAILRDDLKLIKNQYMKPTGKRPIIIAVVGPSGSGKTTACRVTEKASGINLICSYTTRQMREGEIDGVDHYFVSESEMPPREQMLAYTFFGGNHYWTTLDQVMDRNLYIVDEEGLRMLYKDSRYDVVSIYINRSERDGIDSERKDRDAEREPIPVGQYDFVVENDCPEDTFICRFFRTVMKVFMDN